MGRYWYVDDNWFTRRIKEHLTMALILVACFLSADAKVPDDFRKDKGGDEGGVAVINRDLDILPDTTDYGYATPIPEPSTLAITAAGLAGLLGSRKRRKRSK